MRDSNFLRDALRAAATEPLDTCTLCGANINRPYEDAHNHYHHADYQPFATATPGAAAVTCNSAASSSTGPIGTHRGHG
jgi:hypothetical protein